MSWFSSKTLAVAALAAVLMLATGCGYHTAGSQASRLPTDVHTIAIPAFLNTTNGFRLEQTLTDATVHEFISRTHYRIVNQASDADAILRGTVTLANVAPITFDTQTGRASTAVVTITMNVSLVDRQGKVLFQNPSYLFREQYQISRELSSFFEEESPAVLRLSRDFARTLVSNVLEAW